MNRAFVARRMAEAPRVLVAEAKRSRDNGSISARLEQALGEDADVVSTADRQGSGAALDAAKILLSDHVFSCAVMDVDVLPAIGDEAALKRAALSLATMARQNITTSFIFVSSSSQKDAAQFRQALLESARANEDEVEGIGALEQQSKAVSLEEINEEVRSALRGDAFLAQFKSRGFTYLVPPLDPLLVSLTLRLLGTNEFAVRLPGVLLAIVLLCLLLRISKYYEQDSAFFAALALFTSPLFYLSARFVENRLSWAVGLAIGIAFLLKSFRGTHLWALIGLPFAFLFLYLAGGMTATVNLAAVSIAWSVLVALETRSLSKTLSIGGVATFCTAGLAILTFIPESAFFKAFRFTAATFSGGMRTDAKTFDFVINEMGFGLFPWFALLPLAFTYTFRKSLTPERLLLFLWCAVPFVVAMVAIRPFNQPFYAGFPGLAIVLGLYLKDAPEDVDHGRLLAFFGFGLFAVALKDIVISPEPLVAFLTTDPMFSPQGKGDLTFPPEVRLAILGVLAAAIAGGSILIGGGRLLSALGKLPALLRRGRTFLYVLIALIAMIITDIIVFVALKWETLTTTSPEVARGAVLLRIFLTGPDIATLYLVLAITITARYWDKVKSTLERKSFFKPLFAVGPLLLRLERPRVYLASVGVGAFILMLSTTFLLVPRLSYHLSQKHIIKTYEASSALVPGELYRHGTFAARGSEDYNFYTGQVPEITSRTEAIGRLLDQSKRTFLIVPKAQWSELNHAFRSRSGGRHAYVLDDRSSRFILVASTLAPGEKDRNWIAKATIKEEDLKALDDFNKTYVNFDNKIHLIGYSVSTSSVRRGGKVTIRLYFKSVATVSISYRVFMHVDRIGSSSRIHGDHFILNLVRETEETKTCQGCFATNHWLPGDIVVDTYDLEVPIGSPSGPYQVWIGFYNSGGDGARLPVKDFDKQKVRHDGQNRVAITTITVE